MRERRLRTRSGGIRVVLVSGVLDRNSRFLNAVTVPQLPPSPICKNTHCVMRAAADSLSLYL